MLKRLSPRDRFEQLVSTYEPMLRTAFFEAIDDIRSNIVLRRVVESLERGDVKDAIAAMNLDEAAFRPLEEAIRQAYNGGGVSPRSNRCRRCAIRAAFRSLFVGMCAILRLRPGCASTRRTDHQHCCRSTSCDLCRFF